LRAFTRSVYDTPLEAPYLAQDRQELEE